MIINRGMSAAVVITTQSENNEWIGHYNIWEYNCHNDYDHSEWHTLSDWVVMITRSMSGTVVIINSDKYDG